jgi:hypothetical protein
VHAENISVEGQLQYANGTIMSGSHNINITLYNSTNAQIYSNLFTGVALDSNGRFFKNIETTYDFNDIGSIAFKVDSNTQTTPSNIGYVPYAINALNLGGVAASGFYLKTNPNGFYNSSTLPVNNSYLKDSGDTATGDYTFDGITLGINSTTNRVVIGGNNKYSLSGATLNVNSSKPTIASFKSTDSNGINRIYLGGDNTSYQGGYIEYNTDWGAFGLYRSNSALNSGVGNIFIDTNDKIAINVLKRKQDVNIGGNVNMSGKIYGNAGWLTNITGDGAKNASYVTIGSANNTKVYCGNITGAVSDLCTLVDTTGGSSASKWVDGGSYIYPNSTYADDVNITGNLSIGSGEVQLTMAADANLFYINTTKNVSFNNNIIQNEYYVCDMSNNCNYVNVTYNSIQNYSNEECPAGYYVYGRLQNGSWVCRADSGGDFSIDQKLNTTDDVVYASVKSGNINGTFNWTTSDKWQSFNGGTLTFNESQLSTTYYSPSIAAAVAGTINGGSIKNITHPDGDYDGITFNFTEVAGSPGLDLRINFTGITSFNKGIMRYMTSQLNGNYPIIQLWNYDTSVWEDYPYVGETITLAIIEQSVFDYSEHVSGGIVQMRLYKSSNGNTLNKYYVDWITISKGYGTPSGQEVDPYSVHRDGTTALTADWNAGSYNITAKNFKGSGQYLKNTNYTVPVNSSYLKDSGDTGTGDYTFGSWSNGALLSINDTGNSIGIGVTSKAYGINIGNAYIVNTSGAARIYLSTNPKAGTITLVNNYGANEIFLNGSYDGKSWIDTGRLVIGGFTKTKHKLEVRGDTNITGKLYADAGWLTNITGDGAKNTTYEWWENASAQQLLIDAKLETESDTLALAEIDTLANLSESDVIGLVDANGNWSDDKASYITIGAENQTLITYHNITDIPTCAGTDKLTFDGTDLSCASDEVGGGTGSSKWVDEGNYLRPNETYAQNINITGNLSVGSGDLTLIMDSDGSLFYFNTSVPVAFSQAINGYYTSAIVDAMFDGMINESDTNETDRVDALYANISVFLEDTGKNATYEWWDNASAQQLLIDAKLSATGSGATLKNVNESDTLALAKIDTLANLSESDVIGLMNSNGNFSDWDKDYGDLINTPHIPTNDTIIITESQISDLQAYLTSESDTLALAEIDTMPNLSIDDIQAQAYFDNIANFTETLTQGKICIYDTGKINCNYTDLTGESNGEPLWDGNSSLVVYTTDTTNWDKSTADDYTSTNFTANFDANANVSSFYTAYKWGDWHTNASAQQLLIDAKLSATGSGATLKNVNESDTLALAKIDTLVNLSFADINESQGNWSQDKTSYFTSAIVTAMFAGMNNVSMVQINDSYGNWSQDKAAYAKLAGDTFTGNVVAEKNVTTEELRFEGNTTFFVYANKTCIIYNLAGSKINFCKS